MEQQIEVSKNGIVLAKLCTEVHYTYYKVDNLNGILHFLHGTEDFFY